MRRQVIWHSQTGNKEREAGPEFAFFFLLNLGPQRMNLTSQQIDRISYIHRGTSHTLSGNSLSEKARGMPP